jgi:hypothetical protein
MIMQVYHFPPMEIARYEINLRAEERTTLPPFLGSTLRGAFGHALKEAVCVMQHRDCQRCMLIDRCLYPYLFETPVPPEVSQLRGQKNAPHPFILIPPFLDNLPRRIWRTSPRGADDKTPAIPSAGGGRRHAAASREAHPDAAMPAKPIAFKCETESPAFDRRRFQAGEHLKFGLTLIGRAIEQLPYVVYAVQEMARRGLGVDRGRFALVDVASLDEAGEKQMVYTSALGRFLPSKSAPGNLRELVRAQLGVVGESDSLKLRFVTPTRIRVQDDLQAEMSFELLVRNLLRRISMLVEVHGGAKMEVDFRGLIARAASVEKCRESLRWDDWERYSNRQQTNMRLGGFVGEIDYSGAAIKAYLPLVAAGELLHIGAGTSFGLGKYEIVT